jgi:hypothetical protein
MHDQPVTLPDILAAIFLGLAFGLLIAFNI